MNRELLKEIMFHTTFIASDNFDKDMPDITPELKALFKKAMEGRSLGIKKEV